MGLIGAWLLRKQGASILQQIQSSASQSQLPSEAIARGFFTFIGGVLLLTPGLITDAVGMSLIFPPTQFLWKKYFMKKWKSGVNGGRIHIVSQQDGVSMGDFIRKQQEAQGQNFNKQVDSNVIDIDVSKRETTDKKE